MYFTQLLLIEVCTYNLITELLIIKRYQALNTMSTFHFAMGPPGILNRHPRRCPKNFKIQTKARWVMGVGALRRRAETREEKPLAGEWRWVAAHCSKLAAITRSLHLGAMKRGILSLSAASPRPWTYPGNFLWSRERKASVGNPDFPPRGPTSPWLAMFSRLYIMTENPHSIEKKRKLGKVTLLSTGGLEA